MVDGRTFFETMREFEEGKLGVSMLGELWDRMADRYPLPGGEGDGEKGADDRPPPAFIHLVEARVMTPGGGMPGEGMPWRGRLTSVDGWTFGTLGMS
jgi:hypothetical protein